MKRLTALSLALILVACSEPPPPPKPVAAAPAPQPAPKPEAKPEPPKPDPNQVLAARVKQALEAPDAKLPTGAIDVRANNGRVSLFGAVGTAAQRSRAAALAAKVEGVTGVDNQLQVVKGS